MTKEKKVKFQKTMIDFEMVNVACSNALEQASVPSLLGLTIVKEETDWA